MANNMTPPEIPAGTPIPTPAEPWREPYSIRGTGVRMAQGNVHYDTVGSPYRKFVFQYQAIDDADRAAVNAAFVLAVQGTTLKTPYGATYNVVLDPSTPRIDWTAVASPGGLRWSGSFTLMERF